MAGTVTIAAWMEEIKTKSDPEQLGMILMHNGIVRGTSKQGEPVKKMNLSYDADKLGKLVAEQKMKEGIVDIRVWINSGELQIGDDIMLLLVAGRFRTDVLPVFEFVLSTIKKEIVREQEIAD
jgi:molybdopterin synthase catalytic subunit